MKFRVDNLWKSSSLAVERWKDIGENSFRKKMAKEEKRESTENRRTCPQFFPHVEIFKNISTMLVFVGKIRYNEIMEVSFYYEQIKKEEKFQTYRDILIFYNEKFNLTAVEPEEIFVKHFLDSVLGESMIAEGAKVADVGAGAGFPSLPIKILRDDVSVTLLESIGKKCEFLKTVTKELSLANVEVVHLRAEEAGKNSAFRENFDCCCSRAVARLNTLAEYCLPLVKVGGNFLAYKGEAEEERREAARAISLLGAREERKERFDLFDCGKRTILSYRKIRNTPQKYPRGQGRERRSPL